MNKRIPSPLAIAAGCILLGSAPALLEWLFASVTLRRFALDAAHGMAFSCCIGIPCWLILPRVGAKLQGTTPMFSTAVILSLLGTLGVAGSFLGACLLVVTGLTQPAQLMDVFRDSLKISLLITFAFGIVSLIFGTLQTRLADTREQLHIRQIAEERERKMAAEARFASLESRVHPHFLFNTLNSILALVREDPREAEQMIERLSALLRFSLDSETSGVVSLGEELRVVKAYLDIEQVRFGDRLRYKFDIDPEAESRPVPALSIQTLVENSVKYAVGSRREGAEIRVYAHFDNGCLRVEVSDDGPGFEPATSLKPGHGLDLLKRRLVTLFGTGASLEMSAEGGRMLIAMSLAA